MTPMQSPLALPQLTLAYREWGHGMPVILLHGLVDHGLVWQPLAEAWQDQAHCFAKVMGPYSMATAALPHPFTALANGDGAR